MSNTKSISFRLSLVALSLGITSANAEAGQPSASAQANNPLANTTALNFQNYYIGEFTGDNDADYGNQVDIRYAQPFHFKGDWLARATLPVNTFPDSGGHTTGLGDFNIFAAYLIDTGDPAISFGVGPQLTMPTATDSVLGSEKWSAGFANVLFDARSKRFQYGYLLTWQASFAGPSDVKDVNSGAFQPFLFLQMGEGWYLRSAPIMVYDFESDDYTIPVGLGVGKVIPTESVVYNLFVEPQYSVADRGSSFAQWQLFAGLNLQY